MFINPSNIRAIAESMTEITDRVISPNQIEEMEESKRKYLLSLRYKWMTGEDGVWDVVREIKKELGIREYLDKKQAFIKTKFN